MSDLNLRKFILEELEFQPDIDAANIGVTVENGVVTLTGHVNSYAQKISAERAVKAIKGACAGRGNPGQAGKRRRHGGRHHCQPSLEHPQLEFRRT